MTDRNPSNEGMAASNEGNTNAAAVRLPNFLHVLFHLKIILTGLISLPLTLTILQHKIQDIARVDREVIQHILNTLATQSNNQDQMIDTLATQIKNQDQMIDTLATQANNQDQMIGNITAILQKLQEGQLQTQSTVREQGIQIEQNAANIAQVDNRVNEVVDEVAEMRGRLDDVAAMRNLLMSLNATEQQPSDANRLNRANAEVGIGLPDANAVEVDGNPPAQEQEPVPDLNQAEEAF